MKLIKKLSYGMARLGSSILMTTVDITTILMYVEIFGLAAMYAGIAAAVSKIVIALTQFLSGYFSDKTITRFGKRKPYVIVGAPLSSFAYAMLYLPMFLGIPATMLFGWMLLFDSLYHIGYGILSTPYQSWLPEITRTSAERLEISAYQNVAGILATFTGTILAFALPDIVNTALFVVLILSFSVITVVCYLPPLIFIKEESPQVTEVSLGRLWEDIKHMSKNKDFLVWLLVQGIVSLGIIVMGSTILGYGRMALGLTGTLYYIAATCFVFVIMVSFIFWKKLATKHGNKKALSVSLVYSSIIFILAYPLGVAAEPSFEFQLLGLAYMTLLAIGIGGWYLFPNAIIADIARADNLKTGYELCGLFTGFPSIPLNAFQAVGLVITGYLLSLPPIIGTYSAGYLYWGIVAAVFVILGTLILQKGEFSYDFAKLQQIAEERKKDAL